MDRLPVIITKPSTERIFEVLHLTLGTGNEITFAVDDTLQGWDLLNKVQAFVFNSTASDSGRLNRFCVPLEQMLNTPLLFLASMHYT